MKNVLSKLIFCLLFSTITLADINVAKEQCEDLGFKPGTEKYADCVMKLLPKEKSKKQQPNADKVIKEIDQNIKKIGEDIAKSLKIEIAVKGKKLKNFFTNNDLILISENGSREYKFKEKNYEIIKDDTVIQKGSWKIHGLLQNQIRLISKDDKNKYYLKKISKKPWIYNYDKRPGSEGAKKEILHIKSSSKFSDISSNVEFSSTNSAELTESKLEETKIAKKEITKEINIKENKIEVIKKENKVDKIEVTKKVEPKIEKDDGIDLLSSTKNKKKKKLKKDIIKSKSNNFPKIESKNELKNYLIDNGLSWFQPNGSIRSMTFSFSNTLKGNAIYHNYEKKRKTESLWEIIDSKSFKAASPNIVKTKGWVIFKLNFEKNELVTDATQIGSKVTKMKLNFSEASNVISRINQSKKELADSSNNAALCVKGPSGNVLGNGIPLKEQFELLQKQSRIFIDNNDEVEINSMTDKFKMISTVGYVGSGYKDKNCKIGSTIKK